ncbi:hypothetical protein E1200_09335, partial [Actinomadura sp. GC306]|uniref:protein kinase domain-containing protein n=1 Tax=Actinomadura sp. GC306 TaxID=2530367 RepID=UPI0010F20AF1
VYKRQGEFWLSGRLGAGGQGVVYDAYGPDGVRVAVKVLHGAQDSPRELAQMAAEARAAQRVASFCTAKILDVRLEPPRPYIVSEYIDGLSLQGAVNGADGRPGRRFGGDDLHRLGIGIITALTAIHQAKVVHRDLKPGNVMLGPDGPRLIDFGIARVLDTHTATEGGGFAGTLRYMAPEAYAGQRAGAEADVFAWGAIMVFAATGQHAFKGGTLPEIAHAIRTHEPDLSALPDALRPLVGAALAKDPLARPAAGAILAALTQDPHQGSGDLQELVAAGAAQAESRSRWEPGDPALGKVAEDAFAALPPREQSLVPEVFLRCVVPGEDGNLTIRPVPAAELSDRDDPSEAQALEHVVWAFRPLLVVTGEQVVLTRPALLRAWPRLRSWADEEREGLAVHHRIRRAARTWADHGRRRGDVLTGAHLDEAVHWAATPGRRQSLNRLERGLLDASTRAQTARGRRIRAVAAVLAVTTVVSLTATGWAVKAQRTSVDQRDVAASRQLAAQSRQFAGTDPDKAALLAVAAGNIRETPESRAALMNIVTNPARGVLSDYKGTPITVAADGDGRMLAIGNEDGTVALWDVRRHRQIGGFLRLLKPSGPPTAMSVALSPDGRTLAAAAAESGGIGEIVQKAVRLWDVRTRRPLGDLPVSSEPSSVVFTSDGKSVAVDNGEVVELWDVGTLRRRGRGIPSDEGAVIGPRAKTVAVNTAEGVAVWDLATGRRTATFPAKGDVVALGPDGRTVVTRVEGAFEAGDEGDEVYLWDARTGRQRGATITVGLQDDEVGPFSSDGQVVVIGTQLWETGGTQIGSIANDGAASARVAAFVGKDTVVSLGGDGSTAAVRLWDVKVRQSDRNPFRFAGAKKGLDYPSNHGFSPDGRTLIAESGTSDGLDFRTWDVTSRKETQPALPGGKLLGAPLSPRDIVVTPDGRRFVTGEPSGLVLWDPAARRASVLQGSQKDSVALAMSSDGHMLASGGGPQDGNVHLWDLRTRTLAAKLSPATEVSALAFSRDGSILAAGSGRSVRLWNVAGRKELTPPISGLTDQVNAVALAPDNRTLAIGAGNTTVLWDVRAQRQIGTPLTGHSDPVSTLAFNRDGTTLATGGEDQAVRLWDVTSQSQIGAPLTGHSGPPTALFFSPDTKTLTTSDLDVTIRRWNIAMPADPAEIACSIAGRTLTRAEWTQYVAPGIDYRDVCPSLSRLG